MTKEVLADGVLTKNERIYLKQFTYGYGRVVHSKKTSIQKFLRLGFIVQVRDYKNHFKVYQATEEGKRWLNQVAA